MNCHSLASTLKTWLFFLGLIASTSIFSEEELDFPLFTLEQLAEIKISSSTALTPTTARQTPSSVTTIDAKTLEQTNPSSLARALEIEIPNFQMTRSVFNSLNLGLRGIDSDRDDKYLLLVNGHPVHFHFLEGVQTEKMLGLFGDLNTIDVVRGPSSTLYGPGALAGVINLKTHTGFTFQGLDLKLSQRFIDQNTLGELRWGKNDGDTALFFYYGFENHLGADHDDSPIVYGNSFTAPNGQVVESGAYSPFSEPKDHHYERVKHKIFFDFTSGDFNAWVRFNREGEQQHGRWQYLRIDSPGQALPTTDMEQILDFRTNEYQTLLTNLSYHWTLTDKLKLKLSTGWDYKRRYFTLSRVDNDPDYSVENSEQQWWTKSLFNYEINSDHHLAFGIETALEHYKFYPHQSEVQHWNTYSLGYLAEHQWHINDQWTNFLGMRLDKHTYTNHIFSPRWSLVYTPDSKNTWKWILARSVRRAADLTLKLDHDNNMSSEVETLDLAELRYERKFNSRWHAACSVGFQIYKPVDVVEPLGAGSGSQQKVGDYDIGFIELELTYQTDDWRFRGSHSYTQLLDSDETDLVDPTLISVHDKGKGKDLAHWSNHQTKFSVIHSPNDKFDWYTSLVVYWGFPGTRDLAQYNSFERPGGPSNLIIPYIDPDYEKAFDLSAYLDSGFQYKWNHQTTVRLDLYNILGWIDKDWNKRNYRGLSDTYRSEAPAINIGLHYSF